MELEVVAGGVPSKKERDDCGEGGSGDDYRAGIGNRAGGAETVEFVGGFGWELGRLRGLRD